MADLSEELSSARRRLGEADQYLRIDEIRDRRIELEDQAAEPDLWDDMERARKVNRELAEVTEDTDLFDRLTSDIDDAETARELAQEDGDPELEAEVEEILTSVVARLDEQSFRSHFERRAERERHRDAARYVKQLDAILKIQDHFLELADRYDVPIVDNVSIDNSVRLIIRHVVDTLCQKGEYPVEESL